MLEEGIGDHCHERMTVKARPGSSLDVVETEFFLHLLMGLLADPSRLDRGRQGAQVHRGWQVGKIVFLLAQRSVLADEPGLVSRKMLLTLVPYPLRRPIGDPDAQRNKAGLQRTLGPGAPAHLSPRSVGQHVFSRRRVDRTSGMWRRRGRPRPATGKMSFTSAG